MRLSQWMTANGFSDLAMAEKIGVDRTYITKLRKNQTVPSLQVAALIEKATERQVTRYDWPVKVELPKLPKRETPARATA